MVKISKKKKNYAPDCCRSTGPQWGVHQYQYSGSGRGPPVLFMSCSACYWYQLEVINNWKDITCLPTHIDDLHHYVVSLFRWLISEMYVWYVESNNPHPLIQCNSISGAQLLSFFFSSGFRSIYSKLHLNWSSDIMSHTLITYVEDFLLRWA